MIEVLTASLTLFAVIDMIGNVPLIIRLRKQYGEINSLQGAIISGMIMIAALFVGETLFRLLGIETFHFGLAGAFLIIYFGVKMVLGIEDSSNTDVPIKVTIFPIAFPLISGPGTLTTIMSLRGEYSNFVVIAAILVNLIVIYVVLKSASWIQKKIGLMGITIMERVFGIILIAIGMKLLIQNLILSYNFAIQHI